MSVHSIKVVQHIPVTLQQAWAFFSDPANLQQITPAYFKLRIISTHHGSRVYPGQIIEYRVRPVLNMSWYWMTEIMHVQDHVFFVDEQRYGPYSLWHHQHHFKPVPGGVEMTDIVHYKLPLGLIGDIVNTLFVKKQLDALFKYRYEQVEHLFGKREETKKEA
jgi:ligand-binding SRPBCC domain-containing protein